MKEILLVRHGQTLFNLLNRTQGWSDSPLTEEGRQQARDLGMALRASDLWIDLFISSDRGRALETSRLILESSGLDQTIHESELWREFSFGSLEGLPNDQNVVTLLARRGYDKEAASQLARKDLRRLITETVVELDESGWAESQEDFEKRLMEALELTLEMLDKVEGQRALVLAHGVVMETIFLLLEKEKDLPEIANGKAMLVSHDGAGFQVKKVNLSQF